MACLFGLAAEFGCDEKAAAEFLNYFSNLALTLSDGLVVDDFTTNLTYWAHYECFGCYILENGATYGGDINPDPIISKPLIETPEQLTECGLLLLERLKTSPPFLCATVGWEPGLSWNAWADILRRDSKNAHGVVVRRDILQKFNDLSSLFVPFTNEYSWIPYRGNGWYT
jgi:hypothetical protein